LPVRLEYAQTANRMSLVVGRITFYSAIAANATDADIRLLIISPLIVAVSTGILIVAGSRFSVDAGVLSSYSSVANRGICHASFRCQNGFVF
jgi:hypothetical protein